MTIIAHDSEPSKQALSAVSDISILSDLTGKYTPADLLQRLQWARVNDYYESTRILNAFRDGIETVHPLIPRRYWTFGIHGQFGYDKAFRLSYSFQQMGRERITLESGEALIGKPRLVYPMTYPERNRQLRQLGAQLDWANKRYLVYPKLAAANIRRGGWLTDESQADYRYDQAAWSAILDELQRMADAEVAA